MANYNLSTQQIKDSFEQLAQVSGSIEGGVSGYAVVDGTGSRANTLHVTASQATSASYAPNTGVTSIIAGTNVTIDQATGDVTINSSGGGGGSTDTGSLLVTASSVDAIITYTKGDGSVFTNTINNVANASTATSASHAVIADSSLSALTATSASHAVKADSADSATSASYAVTSSHVTDPNIAYINKNNTFTGTQSFNNISVAGTGSFGYIQSVTGSAKTIGDAFIILNNNTPTQVYAGVKVQDSGSTATTASIQWDGINDQWFFEKEVSGTGEFGVVMGGPEYSDIASPAYLTNNRIAKGNGSHHLNDSNISDNGSIVDINSNTKITGSLTQSGSGLSFFTDGTAGGQTRTIAYSDMTDAGGSVYTDNYIGIIDFPPGLYDNALTMWKSTPAFGQYTHNFSAGDSAGVQLKAVSGSFASNYVYTTFDGKAGSQISGDNIFITAADLLKIVFPGGTTQISSSVGISGSLEVQHGAQINAGIAITGSTESEVVALGVASNTSSLDATNGSFFTLDLINGADTHINQSNTTPGQTYTLKTTAGDGTGTISFNSGFKFSDGTAPTATATAGAVDIYTFVTYTANEVYATAVTNLS